MTPEDLGQMTLTELEGLAARMESAAHSIRNAMMLLNPTPMAQPAAVQTRFVPASALETPVPELVSKRQEREAFLRSARGSPERQEKLSQFKHDGPEEEAS